MFKISFSLLISAIISFNIDINVDVKSLYDLISYTITETMTGLTLGYMTSICFNSLKIGGSLIDMQLGLSMASMYDPNTKDQSTVMQNILYWIGIMVFLSMDGHHMLIKGIYNSFDLVPVGKSILNNNFSYIINVFIQYFIIGFKIAIPLIISLVIADLIMGLISRSVPQLNVMVIGMPVKMLVGIAFFIIALPFIVHEIHNMLLGIKHILEGTLIGQNNMLAQMGPLGFVLSSDKTEDPTSKKLKDARKKGNIAKSKEVTTALTLVGILLIMYIMPDYIILELKNFLAYMLSFNFESPINDNTVSILFMKFLFIFAKIFLPIGLIIMVFGVIGNIIQTGLVTITEGLKPQFSKLNPINGFKNMFSLKSVGNLIKSIVIVAVLLNIGISFVKKNFMLIMKSQDIYFPYLIYTIVDLIKELVGSICLAVIVISILDFAYQKYTYKKSLKMTKQEVKEEFKQMEGDPHVKGQIKQKQREMASRRMMQAVPSATVIVTNPTHISIAIKYEKGIDQTPIVVAKGQDVVAFKIREIAKENDIPIMENKPLARLIYKEVEIDEEIPENMYQAVAEVLVAVYKIKNRYKKL